MCTAGVWRLMGDVGSVSELNAFCPLMCAVTMETGVFAGTTEMAMLWLGGLMRARGLAAVPTGQLLTASFCRTKHTNSRPLTLKPPITFRPLRWIKTLMVDLTGAFVSRVFLLNRHSSCQLCTRMLIIMNNQSISPISSTQKLAQNKESSRAALILVRALASAQVQGLRFKSAL